MKVWQVQMRWWCLNYNQRYVIVTKWIQVWYLSDPYVFVEAHKKDFGGRKSRMPGRDVQANVQPSSHGSWPPAVKQRLMTRSYL